MKRETESNTNFHLYTLGECQLVGCRLFNTGNCQFGSIIESRCGFANSMLSVYLWTSPMTMPF